MLIFLKFMVVKNKKNTCAKLAQVKGLQSLKKGNKRLCGVLLKLYNLVKL